MAETEKTDESQTDDQQTDDQQVDDKQTEDQQTDDQQTDDKTTDEQTVAPERIKELIDRIKQLEEQATVSQQQMALARANPPQGREAPAAQFDIFKEVGLDTQDPEDIPNQGQLKQIMGHYGKVFDSRLADIAFHQAHPDYANLVGTVDEMASGQYAEPLAAAMKANPALIKMIAQSGDPRLAAYEVAKLQKSKKPVKTDDAKTAIDEAVENANRIKSSSNAKGGGALSEEGRYAAMPDKDFLELASTHGSFV